jgi:hypothetical protein
LELIKMRMGLRDARGKERVYSQDASERDSSAVKKENKK